MRYFCHALRHRYSFSDSAFTEPDFYHATAEILFYCRDIDRARICLPFPIVGEHCSAATRVLANALKALGQRPEEDSAPLKTLVIDGVADHTMCELWMNPTDVMNMQNLLSSVETLVLSVRRLGALTFSASLFGVSMWNMIYNAGNLQSLSLTDSNLIKMDDGLLERVRHADTTHALWHERRFPGPAAQLVPPKLTHLELKHIAIFPDDLLRIATAFGPSLEELYMNHVSLMTLQSTAGNTQSDMDLWVGLPNEDPGERQWMAMRFRALMPKLRICRCSHLTYNLLLMDETPIRETFDYADPAGIGRSVSQRFVEVVMGLRQPRLPSGEPMYFLPHDAEFSDLTHDLAERRSRIPISEHDYHAHKLTTAGASRRPDYQYSLDGQFRNCATNSLRELRYISEQVHEGVRTVQQRTADGVEGNVNPGSDLFGSDPAAMG